MNSELLFNPFKIKTKMRKMFLSALFVLGMTTMAMAQEPDIPRGMFGMPQVNANFNDYVAAPSLKTSSTSSGLWRKSMFRKC